MEMTTVSSKYNIAIPTEIRKKMNVKPGQQFWVMFDSGSIKLIPKKDIRDLRGFLKGMKNTFDRDEFI